MAGRLQMAGIAFDAWLKEPFLGQGSYVFSYFFPKNFSGLPGWYGDAKMVHSDYLQVLAEYGLVGLGFVLLLLVTFFTSTVLNGRDETHWSGQWLRFACFGVLLAEAIRAVFDFNLHVLPNLMLFAILSGGGSLVLAHQGAEAKTEPVLGRVAHFFTLVAALCFTGFGVYSLRREIVALPVWGQVEVARAQGKSDASLFRQYVELAPTFVVSRQLARRSLAETSQDRDLEEAREDWKRVIELHPLDGESLSNYARTLDDLERFKVSEEFHLRALEAVGRRENKYGVIHGVGWHLARRAEKAFHGRRSGEALFLFQEAKAAFDESHRLGFSRTIHNRAAIQSINKWISFLEGVRIEPMPVKTLPWKSKLL